MSEVAATIQKQVYTRNPKTGETRPAGLPIKLSGRTLPITEREWLEEGSSRNAPRSPRRAKARD